MIVAPVAIGLGGNVGDVQAAFRSALGAIDAVPGVRVVGVSSLYRTAPVGGVDQDDFLNAAALLAVGVDPHALLTVLQAQEQEAGRVRAERWGPRTLDLDILWWDDRTIVTADLAVPHPRLAATRRSCGSCRPTAWRSSARPRSSTMRPDRTEGAVGHVAS